MPQNPIYSKRCAICRSPQMEACDRLLHRRLLDDLTYDKIKDRCSKMRPPLEVTKKNVYLHDIHHRKPSQKHLEAAHFCKFYVVASGKKKALAKANGKKKELEAKLAHTGFLDSVIEKVNSRLESDQVRPTISDGLKAVELKLKIDDGNPIEKALLSFVESISKRDGPRETTAEIVS